MRPSMKGLGIPVASWLPVVEGETLAVGVSTRVLGVELRCGRWRHGRQVWKVLPWQLGSRIVLSVCACQHWDVAVTRGGMSGLSSWGLSSSDGSMGSGRKEPSIPVTTWKGEGGLSTVSETPEMICWFVCVVALSLRSNTQPRKCIAGKHVRNVRRVGKVRTTWPRH